MIRSAVAAEYQLPTGTEHIQRTIVLVATFAVAVSIGCRGDVPDSATSADASLATGTGIFRSGVLAPTTRVRRGQVDALVTASGSVVAPRLTELGPELAGRLSVVHFDVGDQVAAGEVVFQLDPGPFRTNRQRARAGLALAQAEAAQALQELERVRRLAEQRVAPPQQLDQQLTLLAVAKARVQQEQAAVQSAEQDLTRTEVISPYAAHVVERQLHEGAIVGPGAVVVTIQERTGFSAELDVPAAAASPVRVGDPALLIVEGAAEPIQSTIASVNARIDPETRTYRVRAPVPGNLSGAKAGAFVRAEIRPRTRGGTMIVERAAVLNRDGRAYLFTAEDGLARQIEVTIGATGLRLVEIRTGAKAGDAVIVGPVIDRLADGAPVQAVEPPPLAAGGDTAPSAALPDATPPR